MWGIIGGSGFEKFDQFKTIKTLDAKTPFGEASSGIKEVEVEGEKCIFISRHGKNHELLPSEINYRANIFALKKQGVTKIMSFSAVGSLKKELKPGDLVVPDQYIDRTKSLRSVSFCGEGVVGHVSLAKPVSEKFILVLENKSSSFNFDSHFRKTYVCIEGPYFSTQAESKSYCELKADIIGMTNFPEYALAREAGLSYLPCCFVTDYDCWDSSIRHVTLNEVLVIMKKNNQKAFDILTSLVKSDLQADPADIEGGFRSGLFSDVSSLTKVQQDWIEVLRS